MKTAVITGCSSGIGLHTAVTLAKDGYAVYGTMRDTSKADALRNKAGSLDVRILQLDVTEESSISAAIADVMDQTGRIDTLVNNAGYGQFGSLEETPITDFRAQFETNLFGVIRTIQEVLPAMREQKSGRIVNIGSVAGRMGLPFTPAYISSKFALEGITECMRYELDPFGIQTTIIEPGVIKTPFLQSMKVSEPRIKEYQKLGNHIMSGIQMMVQMGTGPQNVADAVARALQDPQMLPRYVVGADAQMFMEAKNSKSDIEFESFMKQEMFPQ